MLKLIKLFSRGAVVAAIISTSVSASESTTPDFDGIWSARYGDAANGVEYVVRIFSGLGKAEVTFKNAMGITYDLCHYLFEIEAGAAVNMVLNSGVVGYQGQCPSEYAMSFERHERDKLTIITPNMVQLPEADLFAIWRPRRDDETAPVVEGLDILGVVPGMAEDAIEAELGQRNFALSGVTTVELESGEVERVVGYVRSGDGGPAQDVPRRPGDASNVSEWDDRLLVVFPARLSDSDEAPRPYAVVRSWTIPADAGLTVAALTQSLQSKYGVTVTSVSHPLAYDRSGTQSATRMGYDCGQTTVQRMKFKVDLFGLQGVYTQGAISVTCAYMGVISVVGDPATGRASTLDIALYAVDPLWDATFERLARLERAQLEQLYEALSGSEAAAPEL